MVTDLQRVYDFAEATGWQPEWVEKGVLSLRFDDGDDVVIVETPGYIALLSKVIDASILPTGQRLVLIEYALRANASVVTDLHFGLAPDGWLIVRQDYPIDLADHSLTEKLALVPNLIAAFRANRRKFAKQILENLSDELVLRLAASQMDATQNAHLDALLEKQRENTLSKVEKHDLSRLMGLYQVGSLQKAYAAAEAARRGLPES